MTSYTTLVNVDGDTAAKLSQMISHLLPASEGTAFFSECQNYIENVQTAELIDKLLEKIDVILTIDSDTDLEGIFQSLFSIMYTLGDGNENPVVFKSIISTLTANKTLKPRFRLNALVILFNLTLTVPCKFDVLIAILTYAKESSLTKLVSNFYAKYDEWITSWKLSIDQQRLLLQTVSQSLQTDGQYSQALGALIKYFNTYKGVKYPTEVESLVSIALVSAIKSPIAQFSDRTQLLESFNNQSFQGDVSILLQLLQILCDGSLQDFNKFKATSNNTAVLSKYTIDLETIEHNVKLLTLCSLASQATDRILTYQSIQSNLLIGAEEVEMWAIEAISEDLIDASIDQLKSIITVHRYTHRSFGPAQWKVLQSKLVTLRKNLTNIQESIYRNSADSSNL
eukprot:gene13111-17575_t